jgi:ABC-type sugar transport system substrate-binding protein
MSRSRSVVITCSVALAASLTGASAAVAQTDAPEPPEIIYLAPNLDNEFQVATKDMFEAAATELGYDLQTLNANSDSVLQVNQLDTAITEQPDAIILGAVETATVLAGVEAAREAGIKVFNFDRPINETEFDFTSVTDTVALGALGADEVARLLTEKYGAPQGSVLEIMGDALEGYTVTVAEGFDSRMASEYPDIDLQVLSSPGWTAEAAADNANNTLTANPELDAIFLHGDFRVPAVVSVLESHGLTPDDIIFVGTDGAATGLQAIRDGWLDETVQQPLPEQARAIWEFMDEVLAGAPIEAGPVDVQGLTSEIRLQESGPTILLPGQVVDATNVDDPSLWGNAEVVLE